MFEMAVIGGSGLYSPDMLEKTGEAEIATPYGEVSYFHGELNTKKIIFMPRHGKKHSVPPHKINYHANIWALKKLGVKHIIASTAVGSLNKEMRVGDLVIPDQLLDFTKGRSQTFFDGKDGKVVHVDVSSPYCLHLSGILFDCAKSTQLAAHLGGVYVCTEGPRFETAAEIKMYRQLGGDIVGMTSVPESILAREAEICYASFSLVTNLAAGVSPHKLTHKEVYDCMRETNDKLIPFLQKALAKIVQEPLDCECQHALAEFGGFKI